MKCMKSLNIAILLFIATFTTKVFAEASPQCRQSLQDLKLLQERQDGIEFGENENKKTRREIEIERDKLMAQILLHKGVEEVLNNFDETLAAIKPDGDDQKSLKDLIESANNDINAYDDLENKVKKHEDAVENVKTVYNLFKNLGYANSAESGSAFMRLLTSFYNENTPEETTAPHGQWSAEQVNTLEALLNNQGDGASAVYDHLLKLCDGPGVEPYCNDVTAAVNGDNSEHQVQIIKGYLGAMIKNSRPALTQAASAGDAMANDERIHQAYLTQIKDRLPSSYINDSGDFVMDGIEDFGDGTTQREVKRDEMFDSIKTSLAVIKNKKEEFKVAQKNYISCNLRLRDTAECARNHLRVAGVDISNISSSLDDLQTYVDKYVGDSEDLAHGKAELQSLIDAAGAIHANGKMNQLFNEESTQQALAAFNPAAKLTETLAMPDHQCIMKLVDRFTNGNEAEKKSFMNDKLRAMLNSEAVGCNIPNDTDFYSDQAGNNLAFQQKMIDCLLKLKDENTKAALDRHASGLQDQINALDAQLAQIDDTDAFKAIERLKKMEFNRYVNECHDGSFDQDARCSVQTSSVPGSERSFQYFADDTLDVVTYINIASDPEREEYNPQQRGSFDQALEVHDLCSRKVNGEFIHEGLRMCRSPRERVARYHDNDTRIRQLKSYDKNYTTRTAPDGSKIYTKKLGLGYRLGYAALGTTQSWLRFGGRYMQNEARLPYLRNQALYFTQMKAWSDQYSSRFQLGNLHSPATFAFSQQPELFRS